VRYKSVLGVKFGTGESISPHPCSVSPLHSVKLKTTLFVCAQVCVQKENSSSHPQRVTYYINIQMLKIIPKCAL